MRTRRGLARVRKLMDRGQNVAQIQMFAKTDETTDDPIEFGVWEDTIIPTQSSVVSLLPTMTGWKTVTHWAVGSVTFQVEGSNSTSVWIVTIPIDDESKACFAARVNSDEQRPEDMT